MKTTIDMARESHLDLYGLGTEYAEFVAALERFAAFVRADEREACAQVCGKIAEGDPSDPNNNVAEYTIYGIAMECTAAIRARGNT